MANMQMEHVEDKVGSSVSHIGVDMIRPVSSNPLSQDFEVLNPQNSSMDQSMSYVPGSESSLPNVTGEQVNTGPQYLIVTESEGEMDAIWNSLSPKNLPAPAKRKAAEDPLPSSSPRQQSSMPNKRVAQMRPSLSSPRLPQPSTLSKRSLQTQPLSNTPSSLNVPSKKMIRNESTPSKGGAQRVPTPKGRTATMEPSPKGRTDSSEAVRFKMRETLAAALSMVSQPQEKDPIGEKRSPLQPVNTPSQVNVGSQSSQSTTLPVQADNGSLGISSGIGKTSEQESQYNYVLPDADGPFNDSLFVKDELLQGNGLSWAWDMELNEQKGDQDAAKLEQADAGRGEVEKVVHSPEDLASNIEAELFKLFGGVNKKYKEKGRSLMFNLKDRSNPELRERVMSGEISAERLCSMTPEELASKELSEWRMAKAEELAQMKVLPDSDTDVRRLVKKTHKGEYQVEVEQDDGVSVEVSVGSNSFTHFQPKRKEKKAHLSSEASEVIRKDNGEKNISENQDSTGRLTIPADGTDPMQELILGECKDSEFGPPPSFEEFIQDLAVDDPFPESIEQIESPSGKENGDTDNANSSIDLAASPVPSAPLGTHTEKADQTKVQTSEMKVTVTRSESPIERKFSPIVSPPAGEQVWEGRLQLTLTSLVQVIGVFRSGEKTSTKEWPGSMEIKGKVRLDAFEKFIQELPMSRSRAVMVVHFALQVGSSELDRSSFVEEVDSYVVEERLGFGEPMPGIEVYFCPPNQRIIDSLNKHLLKDRTDILEQPSDNNGLIIGVVVWRRPQLTPIISSNSSSHHHKQSSKKHNFKNVNPNLTSKLSVPNNHRPPPQPINGGDDDDDDIPPGFGPGAAREEDDLPEFNFSGGQLSSPTPRTSSRGGVGITQAQNKPSRPVDQMRELIQKYGQQSGNSTPGNKSWKDDDDDIPEWRPQQTRQIQPLHPPPIHMAQSLRPHMFNQPIQMQQPSVVQIVQPPIVIRPPLDMIQNGARWVAPGGGPHVRPPNAGNYYNPQWRQDAPRSRGV